MNIDYICSQLVRMLHCNIVFLDEHGKIEKYYGDMAKECNPLLTDRDFLQKTAQRPLKDYPELLCENNCIFYAILSQKQTKMSVEGARLILGPVSIEKPTRELEKYIIREHHIRNDIGFRLPFCDLMVFGAGILMLYHWISGCEMTLDELWQKNEIEESDISQVEEEVSQVIFRHQECEMPHNPYELELREMDSIQQGNLEMLKESLKEAYRGEVGQLAKDKLRHTKNIAICVITLASRAAIRGGMIPEEAFSMVDGYIMRIEEMNNIVKITAMMRQAEFQFTSCVAEQRKGKEKNQLIERTKNYIFQNLHSEIAIGEIGKKLGVNSSYLSQLFHKVEGMTIQQYIREEKIRLAQNMLRYSEYEIKEISNYLSFCSQSYFGSVFKAQTGMSPASYRKRYAAVNKGQST